MGKTFNVDVEFRKSAGRDQQYQYMVGFTVPNEVNFAKVEDNVSEKFRKNNSIHFSETHQEWFGVKTIDACHDLFMKVEKVLISECKSHPGMDMDVKLAKPESTLFTEAQRALLQPNAKDHH